MSDRLERFRARVRRAQLIVGVGLIVVWLGLLVTAPMAASLVSGDAGAPSAAARWGAFFLVRLWVVGLLPAVCYGLARVMPLRPSTTSVGMAASGEVFLVAVELLAGGPEALTANVPLLLARLLTLAAGVALSSWAIVRGNGRRERPRA